MMVALRSMALLLITLMLVCEAISAEISSMDFEEISAREEEINKQNRELMHNIRAMAERLLREINRPRSRQFKRLADHFDTVLSLQKPLYTKRHSYNLMSQNFLVTKPRNPTTRIIKTWKRNADLINSILALPKGMNDAGR